MAEALLKTNSKTILPDLGIFDSFFEASPTPYLILLPDAPGFTIVAVNDAYTRSTGFSKEHLTGRSIFNILPGNPPPHILQGIKNLRSSLQHVCQHKEAHTMPLQRYEVLQPGSDEPEVKYWNPVNVPILEDGEIRYIVHSMTDITAAILEEQKKYKSEEHFRNLVEHAHVAIAMYTGREMHIQLANEAMINLWGKDKNVIGKTLRQALPELEGQPFHELLDKVYTTGETYYASEDRADLVVNGRLQTFYFNFTYKALRDNKGQIYGILNMAVDVTEQVLNRRKIELGHERFRALSAELEERVLERTRELEEANANMARSNQELEQFAYVASHDLKEPLRKISTFGDRLLVAQNDKLDDEGKLYLSKIINASKRMQNMINDLLSVSLIYGDRAYEPYSLQHILEEVEQTLEYKIEELGAEITCDKLPVISCVPSQFRQLFQNLISNSMKFMRNGVAPKISITHTYLSPTEVNVRSLLKAPRYLQLAISDNGIGFDNNYAEKIFNIFQRLHGKHEYEGNGIGLAICKKVAENHGGTIYAESAPELGTTFFIIIPQS